ncbi:HAD family hydrolase [Tateyamaria sp. SN6-1]|uniref:HAD family hydrolase n=1 Tax=Tateyamaria sp. SN6-1 TaxID=3092148 RepID=UPI0039F4E5DC
MYVQSLLLGSIGVLVETSDLQRQAFNTAFEAHGLKWQWDADTYQSLLEVPGGKARIRYYGLARGVEVDVDALYTAKIAAFEASLSNGVNLRPGIGPLMEAARDRGIKIGFATSTDPRQVDIILRASRPKLDASDFDFVGNRTWVQAVKPAPDIYHVALRELGADAERTIAIEDTPESAQAAVAAGIRTFAYPNLYAQGRSFGIGVRVIERLGPSLLDPRAVAA